MLGDDAKILSNRIEELKIKREKNKLGNLNKAKQPNICNFVIEILAYLIVVIIIGGSIDKLFDSSPFCFIIVTCIGMIAGFKNIMLK